MLCLFNFFVFKVVAKGMINRGKGGAIVNVSAILSHIAKPSFLSYCASKGALDQVTRVMALELGPHQVNRQLNEEERSSYLEIFLIAIELILSTTHTTAHKAYCFIIVLL